MKLGIMQPYFFPYLGYFDLINYTDRWIVFDTPQYIRHGWINRNRILHPIHDWQYIVAPIKKHCMSTTIEKIEVIQDTAWRQRILGQIQHYKKRAPYFLQARSLVEKCLKHEEVSLARLNTNILATICDHLDIRFEYEFFSHMNLQIGPIEDPGDWALHISKELCCSEYVNPPGGASLFDQHRFKAAGIKLTIREMPALTYSCPGFEYLPSLSIVDLLMWNTPEQIKNHLDAHQ